MKSSVIMGLHLATSKFISSPSVSRKYSTSSAWLAGCFRAWHGTDSITTTTATNVIASCMQAQVAPGDSRPPEVPMEKLLLFWPLNFASRFWLQLEP